MTVDYGVSHPSNFRRYRELEKQRTITSMPLAEEREILKQINYTRKQKLHLDEYNAIDKQIQEKRVRGRRHCHFVVFPLCQDGSPLLVDEHYANRIPSRLFETDGRYTQPVLENLMRHWPKYD